MQSSQMTLAEELEYWRARAQMAEEALKVDGWNFAIVGFTLLETQVLRVLADRGSITYEGLVYILSTNRGRESSLATISTMISRCRQKLPDNISINPERGQGYTVPDTKRLRDFIARHEKNLPSIKRASNLAA